MSRRLPDFCYRDAIPIELASAELLACHIRCFTEYRECNDRAKTWDDLDRCDVEYEKCFYDCCEKYA